MPWGREVTDIFFLRRNQSTRFVGWVEERDPPVESGGSRNETHPTRPPTQPDSLIGFLDESNQSSRTAVQKLTPTPASSPCMKASVKTNLGWGAAGPASGPPKGNAVVLTW